jgi:Metallo-beta-lactamase superfamily
MPIYAHPLEMPYLTGKSDYPPQDSTMGGAIAVLSRLFPGSGYDFGDRVRPLPDDDSVPGLEYWRWVHTPGHTPGHVSLFREMDGTLLAGDALATINMDSWISQLPRKRELHRPPAPFILNPPDRFSIAGSYNHSLTTRSAAGTELFNRIPYHHLLGGLPRERRTPGRSRALGHRRRTRLADDGAEHG